MGITEMGQFERKFWDKHCGYLGEEPSWQGAACAEALRVESSSCAEGFGLLLWVKVLPLRLWREKWLDLTWVLIYLSIWLRIDTGSFPVAQLVKNPPTMQETLIQFLGQKIPWIRDRLPTPVFLGFPGGSEGKESTCNERDLGWEDPRVGKIPWNGMATHSSILAWRIPMDRGTWRATVDRVAKNWTQLSDEA